MKRYLKEMSFRKLGCLLLSSFFSLSVQAQLDCGGVVDDGSGAGNSGYSCQKQSATYLNKYRMPVTYVPEPNDPVIIFNITLHIFTPGAPNQNSGNWQNTSDPNNGLPRLNYCLSGMTNGNDERYSVPRQATHVIPGYNVPFIADSKIQFNVTNIYYYANSSLYTWDMYAQGSGPLTSYINGIDPNRLDEGMPIIINGGTNPGFSNGAGVFTSIGPSDEGFFRRHLLHEIGHCFGLMHTYWGIWPNQQIPTPENITCNTNFNPDFLADVFPINNPNAATQPATNPPASTQCNNCYECLNFGTNNFMSDFNSLSPRNWISPLQMGRRIKYLQLPSPIRRFAADAVSDHLHPWNITSDETWDFDIQMYRDIVVKSGSKLTVTCRLAMPISGKIVVEKGAQLIVDGGEITGWCKTGLWAGIEVQGDATKNQSIDANGFGVYQGVLRVINSGLISHSDNAVKTYVTDNNGNIDWGSTGGIIICNNGRFLNNSRDVEFMSYPFASASGFVRTEFRLDGPIGQTYGGGMAIPMCRVSLWNISGVKFLGCNFEYAAGNLYIQPGSSGIIAPGDGIGSLDASYTVDKAGVTPSKFKGFRYGVFAKDINPFKVVNVYNSDFRDNQLDGAHFENMKNIVFYNNYVMPPNVIGSNGLYLYGCQNYHVLNNQFVGNTSSSYRAATGVYAYNSGAGSHEIYRNSFGKLRQGVCAIANNSGMANTTDGLKINCNDFSAQYNNYDIALLPTPYNPQQPLAAIIPPSVMTKQGNPSVAGPNAFVRNIYGAPLCCTGENQWYIQNTNTPNKTVDHWCYSNTNNRPMPQPAFSDVDVLVQSPPLVAMNYAVACPVTQPSSGGTGGNAAASSGQRLANLNTHLSDLFNGSPEYDLPFEIQSAASIKLNCFVGDSVLTDPDSLLTIVNANLGNWEDNDVMRVFAYMHRGEFDLAASKVDALRGVKDDWATLLDRVVVLQQSPGSMHSLSEADVIFFSDYANDDARDGNALARSILRFHAGANFTEPRPLPEDGAIDERSAGAAGLTESTDNAIGIVAYPNPVSGVLKLSYTATNGETLNLTVTDALGRKVYEGLLRPEGVHEISTTGFSNGIYLLNVSNGKECVYQKKITCVK